MVVHFSPSPSFITAWVRWFNMHSPNEPQINKIWTEHHIISILFVFFFFVCFAALFAIILCRYGISAECKPFTVALWLFIHLGSLKPQRNRKKTHSLIRTLFISYFENIRITRSAHSQWARERKSEKRRCDVFKMNGNERWQHFKMHHKWIGLCVFLYFWKLVGMRCDFCAGTQNEEKYKLHHTDV